MGLEPRDRPRGLDDRLAAAHGALVGMWPAAAVDVLACETGVRKVLIQSDDQPPLQLHNLTPGLYVSEVVLGGGGRGAEAAPSVASSCARTGRSRRYSRIHRKASQPLPFRLRPGKRPSSWRRALRPIAARPSSTSSSRATLSSAARASAADAPASRSFSRRSPAPPMPSHPAAARAACGRRWRRWPAAAVAAVAAVMARRRREASEAAVPPSPARQSAGARPAWSSFTSGPSQHSTPCRSRLSLILRPILRPPSPRRGHRRRHRGLSFAIGFGEVSILLWDDHREKRRREQRRAGEAAAGLLLRLPPLRCCVRLQRHCASTATAASAAARVASGRHAAAAITPSGPQLLHARPPARRLASARAPRGRRGHPSAQPAPLSSATLGRAAEEAKEAAEEEEGAGG